MKAPSVLAAFALLISSVVPTAIAADTPITTAPAAEATASPKAELDALITRINGKLQAGQKTPTELAAELAEFDALLAKHAAHKTDEVAQILLLKGMLYVQIFEDYDQGEAILKKLGAEFPDTETATSLPRILARIKAEADAARAMTSLIGQPAPELHFEWASREGLTSLADLKGKVVVLDFWATWCGPCIQSFPAVAELTAHYAGSPVEVVGVTSLQGKVHGLEAQPIDCTDDPAKEHGLMPQFIARHNMTWTVAFSREPVYNPAWGVRGIPYLAIVAPDGTVRHAGLHPAVSLAEKTAKIDAVLEEFGLKVPASN